MTLPVITRPGEPTVSSHPAARLGRIAPFGVAGAAALALLPVAGDVRWPLVAAATATFAALIAAAFAAGSRVLRPDVVGLVGLAAAALLRDGAGGSPSGYGVLVPIPVLYVALYGTRPQVWRVVVAAALVLMVPIVVLGEPRYPAVGWRSGPVLVLCCAVVGLVVQRLLAAERRQAAERDRLLGAISDGVIVTDATGLVLEVNPALCALTGHQEDELVGRRAPLPSWPPEDHERLLAEHAAAIAAGGGRIEARLVRRDGAPIHVAIAIGVQGTGAGRTVIATVRDVTERVRLQRGISAQRDRFAAIAGAIQEGVAVTREGRIVEVNPALCAITGFSREALIGARTPFPFWPAAAREEIETLGRRLREQQGGTFELTLQRADGTLFDAEATAVALHDGEGPGYLHSVRDVTDRKRRERAERDRSRQVAAAARVIRAVSHAEPAGARQVVCTEAMAIAGAQTAAVWELGEDGRLRHACSVGAVAAQALTDPGVVEPAPALLAGAARHVDARVQPAAADLRLVPLERCVAVHMQPVRRGGATVGVVAVGWSARRAPLDAGEAALMEVLAEEAAASLARSSALDALEQRANTDPLTGLPNRRVLEERLADAGTAGAGTPLTLAIVDLDHFKRYNDTHGHPAGDRLLRAVSAAWSRRLRRSDLLVRWGGEEFCLLLHCDEAAALRILDELRAVVPDGQTFSAGVAQARAGWRPDALVATADAALYAAKRGGRDRSAVAPG